LSATTHQLGKKCLALFTGIIMAKTEKEVKRYNDLQEVQPWGADGSSNGI